MAGDDDYEIPDTGAVFTFGRSRFAENVPSHFFIRNDPVVEISCGDEHTALVCTSGRVFLFGNNDYGQLGFGHTKVVNKPSCLKYLKPFHSTHVACGKGHTIISTACGRLFTFGCNSDGQLGIGDLNDRVVPQMISTGLSEGENIAAVAAGCHHSAFLTDGGDLYLWGCNTDGQCGAEEVPYVATPRKIDFKDPISSISCGYYHTAFTSVGCIYTFGEEDNGKLGRPKPSEKSTPEKVSIEENCIAVKCGGNHTMVLTVSGVVYAFGSNFSGQLGIANPDPDCSIPGQVELPEDVKIVYISCGESHSAFVTDKGALYTCGDGRHGKLCNEDESANFTSPTKISSFENYTCISVSCGGCHTMVLAKIKSPENDTDVIPSPKNKLLLPPLKVNKEVLEVESVTKDTEEVVKGEELERKEERQQEIEELYEGDDKSNTESNMNSEEITSHVNDIYTEIEEIPTETNETETNMIEVETKTTDPKKETSENDLVVVRTESKIKKLMNVFKRKKSATAILVSEKSVESEKEVGKQKVGNHHRSRACIIL